MSDTIQVVTKAAEIYDREYFEDGLAKGKSLYNGFNWMPERSCREAMAIIDAMKVERGIHSILDFGCAKGFLVKALRLLGRDAYGCDVSRYAICTSDTDVRQYLRLCCKHQWVPFAGGFYLCIAKDVFEHLNEAELDLLLPVLRKRCKWMFVAVPVGDGKKFIVPEYNYDATHKIAETPGWWADKFKQHGFDTVFSEKTFTGIKDNWLHYQEGNRFFSLKGLD